MFGFGKRKRGGKFEIFTDKDGKVRFRLKAGNGEIIATSESYETVFGARNGIEAVKELAEKAKIVELWKLK